MKNKLLNIVAFIFIPILGFNQSFEYTNIINDWLKGEIKILNYNGKIELNIENSVLELSNFHITTNSWGNFYRYIQNVIDHSTEKANYSVFDKVKIITDSLNHHSVYSNKDPDTGEEVDFKILNFKTQKNNFQFKQENLEKFKGKWLIDQIYVNEQVQFLDGCHKSYSLRINELGDFLQVYSDSTTYCKTKIDSLDYSKVIQLGEGTLFRSATHQILGKIGKIFTIDNNILFSFDEPLLFMYKFRFQDKKLMLKNHVTEIVLIKSD